MEISNRIMMPGMSAGMMLDNDAHVLPEMIAYFVERAKARPGLMAVGASQVVPPPTPQRAPVALYHDKYIASLAKLVEGVHQYDVPFGIQLWDGGTQAGGGVQLSPSGISPNAAAVYDARARPELKTLSLGEIEDVVRYFAEGALRCKAAGFDFVEIHAGHGYLISAFLAPFFNRRNDCYGGSLENRARFLIEILRAVKAAVGDTGVGVKINGDDYMQQGGWGLEEACKLGPMLEREGADYLSITAGVMGGTRLTVPPLYEPQGCFTDLGIAVKKEVKIPVATIGRIKDPIMANELIASGKVDIVCMGRAMIADSEIVEKMRRGDLDDIRKCLADCRGCIDQEMRSIKRGAPGQVSCVVNPRMQRESVLIDIEGSANASPRKVLVIGGGLAGLEAARRTAFSGHHVTLCESRGWLGGQIRYAAMVPCRNEIADMLPWYERQLRKYHVDVRLDTTVDAALIAALAPDEARWRGAVVRRRVVVKPARCGLVAVARVESRFAGGDGARVERKAVDHPADEGSMTVALELACERDPVAERAGRRAADFIRAAIARDAAAAVQAACFARAEGDAARAPRRVENDAVPQEPNGHVTVRKRLGGRRAARFEWHDELPVLRPGLASLRRLIRRQARRGEERRVVAVGARDGDRGPCERRFKRAARVRDVAAKWRCDHDGSRTRRAALGSAAKGRGQSRKRDAEGGEG